MKSQKKLEHQKGVTSKNQGEKQSKDGGRDQEVWEDKTRKVPFCFPTRSSLVSFIRRVAGGTVEAETRFRRFESEQEVRKERKAETILLRSLLLRGIKETAQELGGAHLQEP